jgi:hypothetical protein
VVVYACCSPPPDLQADRDGKRSCSTCDPTRTLVHCAQASGDKKKTQRYVRTYARDHAVLLTARGKGPVHKASGKRHARPKLKAGKWQWLLDTRHMHDFSGKKATSTEIWGISDDSTWHIYIASVYAQKILSLVFRGPIKLADDTHSSFWVCEDTIPW